MSLEASTFALYQIFDQPFDKLILAGRVRLSLSLKGFLSGPAGWLMVIRITNLYIIILYYNDIYCNGWLMVMRSASAHSTHLDTKNVRILNGQFDL